MANVSDRATGAQAKRTGFRNRDARLRELLPAKDAPYSYHAFTPCETQALTAALGDGFGEPLEEGRSPRPLPVRVKSGLLKHPFYPAPLVRYHEEDEDEAFWDENGDSPPPSFFLPLGFHPGRLRIYFENQFERFCAHVTRERKIELDALEDRWIFEEWAYERLYEKPWYEIHAVHFLDFMEDPTILKYPSLAALFNKGVAGQLGRLIEQYFWRFRYERAAISGTGAREGASAGGKAKAAANHRARSAWQKAANEIWARRPDLSKLAVATAVGRELRTSRSPKHIARYIQRS